MCPHTTLHTAERPFLLMQLWSNYFTFIFMLNVAMLVVSGDTSTNQGCVMCVSIWLLLLYHYLRFFSSSFFLMFYYLVDSFHFIFRNNNNKSIEKATLADYSLTICISIVVHWTSGCLGIHLMPTLVLCIFIKWEDRKWKRKMNFSFRVIEFLFQNTEK